ncbi:DNA sulfur modification protein DndB [Litorivivens lipolytica]|uniref:DNA sulfur modification protein DndB n=1 Tax=Litorivivens lipolytica TaxID=1524264 RepID=A0A7W4W4R5_9GAMM|nr:DNA sulfur modification protein DndB [Litorivivens lipolytica]MBB3047425.1 DNA sulfur modification protein DndB [Litorivivens lipolytica]
MAEEFNHNFPAIRGIQAGKPCYIAMCPMRIVPKLFKFDEDEVPADLRAQRTLNIARIPEITSYLVENQDNYTLSSLTASINSKVKFEPFTDTGTGQNMGTLSIPMDAQILINDGQHRRKAIEEAIKENPELGHDNISVLFFIDEGLARSQQMFADLNKHAVRPSDSISTLYDLRDALSELARFTQKNVEVFYRLTELEKSSLSNRSTKLFTLSAIKNANKAILSKPKGEPLTLEERQKCVSYWNTVSTHMKDWQLALDKKVSPSELRENYIHAHAVMLQAMGMVGKQITELPEKEWGRILAMLDRIDWSRLNPEWSGRALEHGRISKKSMNVALTANLIKQKLKLPLTKEESLLEKELME